MSEAPRAGASLVPTSRPVVHLKLVVKVDQAGVAETWEREVERPYPAVPRPDDWVYLGDGENAGLAAQPVSVVTWENDGSVTLRFDVGGDASWLETLGFAKG
jgi:hypothetical protein